ncbi:scavenger receptor cysteine-rich type 1 protein M130-like [Eleutherodactylus coqui]|uniref:scavenger receptor cysteine-rich type 1 protein M130-like n=1 Tax=Eleutherodactylus coqui TaxID=57060 RepID=UPI0034637607
MLYFCAGLAERSHEISGAAGAGHREYRLVNGPHRCSGYLEIRDGDTWGSVCEIDEELKAAKVICSELKCGEAVPTLLNYTRRPGPIWREQIHCSGHESSLYGCLRHDVEGNCTKQNPPAIECEVPVRLSGGDTKCEGLVEVRFDGEWWVVNDMRGNTKYIADVVCRELGCNITNVQHRVTTGEIFVDDERMMLSMLLCNGEESSLSECGYVPFGLTKPSANLIGVRCSVPVRLSGGYTECEGLVEVRYEEWWAVEYNTDNRENIANVVCKELGCNTINIQHRVTRGDIFVDDGRKMLDLQCRGEESSLSQCEYSINGIQPSVRLMGVKCSALMRLSAGNTECEGLVEVRYLEKWWAMKYDTDNRETIANVLCRELGCNTTNVPHGVTTGDIFVDDARRTLHLRCGGEETSWSQCERSLYDNIYPTVLLIGVKCSGHREYRLADGASACSGHLEARHGDTWGSVCEIDSELRAANVLCKELQCGEAVPSLMTYTRRPGPIWTEQIHCVGNESRLYDCIRNSKNRKCTKESAPSIQWKEETVRLMSGEDHCAGRLEILTHNTWSRAVSDQWGINETQVVCRELHCGHAVGSLPITASTTVGGHVYLSGNCQGNETQLTDCSVTESSNRKTWTGQETEIEMICSESNQLRLVDGPGRCAGRVEIYHDGRWGTICDDSWDEADADVVCKQLGCGHGVRATTGVYYGRGTGDIWLDDVECEGNERYIRDCPAKQFGDHDCGHKEDAGVICSELLDLRLVDGSHECEGWLEVYYNGSWGSVCNNVMPVLSVSVICKHLKCGSKGYLEAAKYDVKRRRPFWVDHINCTKYNKLLWECPSSPWNINSCTDRELAYIVCEGSRTAVQSCPTSVPCSDNDRIHLIGGENNCSGRVEVFFQGEWGTVCDDEWDIKDAEVVCRQIGCGSAVNSTTEASYGKGAGPIWLSEVQCKGYERTLQDCWAKRWNKSDCLHKEDAGVICLGPDDFSRTVLTTTPAQSPALPSTFTVSNVFFMISIISLLLLGIAVIIIIYLITQSKWHKKDPVYEDLAFTLMEKNKRLSQKSVDNLSDLEEKLEYYTSDERKYEKLDQGAESDQIPSYDDVDDINGENSPSSPLKKKTSEYDYDDAGLFYETNDVSATGVERNGKEHGYDDVDIELLSRSVNSGEVATHANNGQLGPSWEDVLHLSDEQIVSISDNQDEIHLSVDPDYDDSMSA